MYHIESAYKSKAKTSGFQERSLLSGLSPFNLYNNDPVAGTVNWINIMHIWNTTKINKQMYDIEKSKVFKIRKGQILLLP